MPVNNSTNAFSILMNQSQKFIPPRDTKQQEGPKNLWNKIADWLESISTARFRKDEKNFMMELMNVIFDALW